MEGEHMNIKELRQAAGMTQREFCEYFNIPRRTVENWESDKVSSEAAPYIVALIEYRLTAEGKIKRK